MNTFSYKDLNCHASFFLISNTLKVKSISKKTNTEN